MDAKIFTATFRHGGTNHSREFTLEDDGRTITAPTDYPTGGTRRIVARTGEWEAAWARVADLQLPYWIGGAGYSAQPSTITRGA